MTFVNSTPTNHKTAETLADRHREGYAGRPSPRPSRLARLRPWLIGTAAGLAIGGAAAFAVSYQVMPPMTTHVQNLFVNIGGRPAVILSGDVVFDSTPLPPTPVAQP